MCNVQIEIGFGKRIPYSNIWIKQKTNFKTEKSHLKETSLFTHEYTPTLRSFLFCQYAYAEKCQTVLVRRGITPIGFVDVLFNCSLWLIWKWKPIGLFKYNARCLLFLSLNISLSLTLSLSFSSSLSLKKYRFRMDFNTFVRVGSNMMSKDFRWRIGKLRKRLYIAKEFS